MTTREEFEGLVVTLLNCESDAEWHKRCGTYDDATIAAMERRDEARAAVFAVYDAQAARITELERECDKLASVLLKRGCDGMVSECAAMEARIAELEAQRDALLAACEAALEAIRSDADVDWMLNVESQCCAAIAKARGEVPNGA